MKATAVSYPNIAFNKYWGNYNKELRLPYTNTISMNLDGLTTKTTIEFSPDYKRDSLTLNGQCLDDTLSGDDVRVSEFLDKVRVIAGIDYKARVVSENNFPTRAGIASSASAFSALALACNEALDLKMTEAEISSLARLGSGSACRSIPGGFVEWRAGTKHETSYSYQLVPPEHFDIRDIVAVVSDERKEVSSSAGHDLFETTPFKEARLAAAHENLIKVREGILMQDFHALGKYAEKDALEMHATIMTSDPAVFYWNGNTLDLFRTINHWRQDLPVYFTTDAGPNVHILTKPEFETDIVKMLEEMDYVKNVMSCKPGGKPYITDKHLF